MGDLTKMRMRPVDCLGNLATAGLLLAVDIPWSLTRWLLFAVVGLLDKLFGSGCATVRNKREWHSQRYSTQPIYKDEERGELDAEAMIHASDFPIRPEDLLDKARRVLDSEFGTKDGCDPKLLLADDFQFVAPIIGPLTRTEFVRAFGSFKVRDAFPDLKDNSVFSVDPMEPNRVWFVSRATGTHTGALNFARPIEATGRRFEGPPQAQSLLFDEQGKVYTLTVGYCMDKRIGNTNGLGGVFGILQSIGHAIPVPEAQQLYTPSLRFEAFERLGKAMEALGYDPNTRLPLES